jgi:hypothetical protein
VETTHGWVVARLVLGDFDCLAGEVGWGTALVRVRCDPFATASATDRRRVSMSVPYAKKRASNCNLSTTIYPLHATEYVVVSGGS